MRLIPEDLQKAAWKIAVVQLWTSLPPLLHVDRHFDFSWKTPRLHVSLEPVRLVLPRQLRAGQLDGLHGCRPYGDAGRSCRGSALE
ncbi:subtilisin-like serine protease [Colletotrichum chrysophilum]|uniref:Subtilisin-like serine protease n=1 Tax=Colletotrichum chrysophilum TaxID=1836956 RepID=A0AAD8ZY84_9PEZI|nr:subtilisin-like serine protease [Colletotrichum chrysophilum]